MNSLPRSVEFVEVGPRDGLQNEQQPITVANKLELIRRLAASGFKRIEAGSFVSPRWVPQMAGSDELFSQLHSELADSPTIFTALTPNQQGLERALAVGVKEVAVFAAATESFSQKNINCSIAESLQRFAPTIQTALAAGVPVRGYISCAVGCPFEGAVAPAAVASLTADLLAMGCYQVSLGDTIGVGTARQIDQLVDRVAAHVDRQQLALHLHDTYGQAVANTLAGLQAGIRVFDAAVAGLGGCPYAPGATGNVATEDLVYLCNGLGIEHGIDLPQLLATGRWISQQLNRPYQSKAGTALSAANHHK